MTRKEFIKELYNRIANNISEGNKQLDASDFSECLCNISNDGKNDSIYIELDSCKVPGGGTYKLSIEEIEKK